MKKSLLVLFIVVVSTIFYFFYFRDKTNTWKIKNKNPQGKTIVCFGDSLTSGYGADKGKDYPSQLSRLLNTPVVNLGISGNTTEDALKRIGQVINEKPRIVMITLGGNDLKNRVPKKEAFENLEKIVKKIQDSGALVIIGGIEIPFFGKSYTKEYVNLAQRTGSVLIPNIYSGILTNPKLMSDRIHPNSDGYRVMAEYFYKVCKPYIEN